MLLLTRLMLMNLWFSGLLTTFSDRLSSKQQWSSVCTEEVTGDPQERRKMAPHARRSVLGRKWAPLHCFYQPYQRIWNYLTLWFESRSDSGAFLRPQQEWMKRETSLSSLSNYVGFWCSSGALVKEKIPFLGWDCVKVAVGFRDHHWRVRLGHLFIYFYLHKIEDWLV